MSPMGSSLFKPSIIYLVIGPHNSVYVINLTKSLTPINLSYILNGSELQWVSNIKYLRIEYSSNFSFSYHIDVAIDRALKFLGFTRRNSKVFHSVPCLWPLYFTMIAPWLWCCCLAPLSANDLLRLEWV